MPTGKTIKKTKKKYNHSKQKGNSFERLISKELSQWYSNGTSDDIFYRTAGSGSRATVRKKKGMNTENGDGDISFLHPSGKHLTDVFHFELKNYKDICLYSLLEGKGLIIKWWTELTEKTKNSEKIGILIVKSNNKPILWISNWDFRDRLLFFYGINCRSSFYDENCGELCLYLFNDLMKLDIEIFKFLLRDLSKLDIVEKI